METINEEVEEVEEVKNEEGTEEYSNEVIEEGTKQEDKEAEPPKIEEAEAEHEVSCSSATLHEPKPEAKPKKQARSVKVVELVACPDCDKKMLPKSLRHSHPRNCKGQPTETRPIKKQQNSYGSKLKEQLRKEIKKEMKTKYEKKEEKQTEAKEQPKERVIMKEPETRRTPTARELLEASYAEIRRAKREAQIEKINGFKSKMF